MSSKSERWLPFFICSSMMNKSEYCKKKTTRRQGVFKFGEGEVRRIRIGCRSHTPTHGIKLRRWDLRLLFARFYPAFRLRSKLFSLPGQGGEGRFRLKIVGLRLEDLPTARRTVCRQAS